MYVDIHLDHGSIFFSRISISETGMWMFRDNRRILFHVNMSWDEAIKEVIPYFVVSPRFLWHILAILAILVYTEAFYVTNAVIVLWGLYIRSHLKKKKKKGRNLQMIPMRNYIYTAHWMVLEADSSKYSRKKLRMANDCPPSCRSWTQLKP